MGWHRQWCRFKIGRKPQRRLCIECARSGFFPRRRGGSRKISRKREKIQKNTMAWSPAKFALNEVLSRANAPFGKRANFIYSQGSMIQSFAVRISKINTI